MIIVVFTGCSMRTVAVRSATSVLDHGIRAVDDEPDPDFAAQSIPSQLKLLEVLLQNDPANGNLLLHAAEGFGGYAFLFLENSKPQEAKDFYLRGRDYALRCLPASWRQAALSGTIDSLTPSLSQADRRQVPALFWAAFNWAGAINLSRASPSDLAQMPKTVVLMQRVQDLDPAFHFYGADLFFGVYYASRPALLGGDARKAEAFFQDARKGTQGDFLMAYVLEARYAAVALQDKTLFESLLKKALDEPGGKLAGARLSDEVAKRQARMLLEKENDYF
jgi:hypothetical protein